MAVTGLSKISVCATYVQLGNDNTLPSAAAINFNSKE